MRQLVLDAVAERLRLRGRLGREIYGGAQDAEKAGRLHRLRYVQRQLAAGVLDSAGALCQARAKGQVRGYEPQSHGCHARVPGTAQDIQQRDWPSCHGKRCLRLRLRSGGALRMLRLRRDALGRGWLKGARVGRGLVYISHNLRRRPLVRVPHEVLDADPRRAEAHRQQQPHQHQQPKRVLQPGAYPAAQEPPEQQHGEDERTGGGYPLKHRYQPPNRAGARTARRSPAARGPASSSGR